jgi:hypothetical protein
MLKEAEHLVAQSTTLIQHWEWLLFSIGSAPQFTKITLVPGSLVVE